MLLLQINEVINKGNDYVSIISQKIAGFFPRLAAAIVIYWVLNWLIKKFIIGLQKIFTIRNFDLSLQHFLLPLIKISLQIMLIISIASLLGFDVTGFAALLAGAGIAIGAALNGTLGNLAGGIIIILFKPYKINDMIETKDAIGIVEEIGLFHTKIRTPDNKLSILPNGGLSVNHLKNYSIYPHVRIDLEISLDVNAPLNKAKEIAYQALFNYDLVLKYPLPEIVVVNVLEGRIQLGIRPYVITDNYWQVSFDALELVKKALEDHDITLYIPRNIINLNQ